jgi:lipoprotein-anchoring transpeptidase ErfK/SrfK
VDSSGPANGSDESENGLSAEKKPRKFWMPDGKYRELKPGEVRPYRAHRLDPDPEPQPSNIKTLEAQLHKNGYEPEILARPDSTSPMIGTVAPGTRLSVRGEFMATSTGTCRSRRWLAILPFGWICADYGKPTDAAPTSGPSYQIVPGERVPYRYVMVYAKEPLPMWASLDDLKKADLKKADVEPERQLAKGDTIAVEKTVKYKHETYYLSAEGKILPVRGTYTPAPTSTWHGILIDNQVPLPFGWIAGGGVKAQAEAGRGAALATLPRRARVDILDEVTVKGRRYLKVRLSAVQQSSFPVATAPLPENPAEVPPKAGQPSSAAANAAAPPAPSSEPQPYWVAAVAVNKVRVRQRPSGMGTSSRWFDADLGEQVLVVYDGDKPVYATLVSSGRNNATPLGNYPVWARVTAISMKSQPYDDHPYFVNMVPWSTFFQAHNAIHGAYWHDRFGAVKSHGCINVAPLDARFIFEWLDPKVPPGWTSLRPVDLRDSPTLHVWDSHRRPTFKQERPIGPPDRDDEAERLEEAEKRRAESAELESARP